MSIQVLDYYEKVFPKQFVFFSGIYFEKRDSDFFVVESDVKSVKKGMKISQLVENQKEVIQILENSKKKNKLVHAYIFEGEFEKYIVEEKNILTFDINSNRKIYAGKTAYRRKTKSKNIYLQRPGAVKFI